MKKLLFLALVACVAAQPGLSRAEKGSKADKDDAARGARKPPIVRNLADIKDDLKLTDAQKSQLHDQRFKSSREMVALRARLEDARLDLRESMSSESFDASAIRSKAGVMADLQAQMTKARIENRTSLLSVLTPEQRHMLRERPRGMGTGGHMMMRHFRVGAAGGMEDMDGLEDMPGDVMGFDEGDDDGPGGMVIRLGGPGDMEDLEGLEGLQGLRGLNGLRGLQGLQGLQGMRHMHGPGGLPRVMGLPPNARMFNFKIPSTPDSPDMDSDDDDTE